MTVLTFCNLDCGQGRVVYLVECYPKMEEHCSEPLFKQRYWLVRECKAHLQLLKYFSGVFNLL